MKKQGEGNTIAYTACFLAAFYVVVWIMPLHGPEMWQTAVRTTILCGITLCFLVLAVYSIRLYQSRELSFELLHFLILTTPMHIIQLLSLDSGLTALSVGISTLLIFSACMTLLRRNLRQARMLDD